MSEWPKLCTAAANAQSGPESCSRDNWNKRSPHFVLNKPSETEQETQIEAARTISGGNKLTADCQLLSRGRGSECDVNFDDLTTRVHVHMSLFFTANKKRELLSAYWKICFEA